MAYKALHDDSYFLLDLISYYSPPSSPYSGPTGLLSFWSLYQAPSYLLAFALAVSSAWNALLRPFAWLFSFLNLLSLNFDVTYSQRLTIWLEVIPSSLSLTYFSIFPPFSPSLLSFLPHSFLH